MRKSELTAEQVKTAEVLLRALAQAGWEMDGWDARFDRGFDVYPELEARFGNERGTLCLTFDPQGDHVSLLAASERFEEVVEFRNYSAIAASVGQGVGSVAPNPPRPREPPARSRRRAE